MNIRNYLFASLFAMGLATTACAVEPAGSEQEVAPVANAPVAEDDATDDEDSAEDLAAPSLQPAGLFGLRKKRCCIIKNKHDEAVYCNTMTGTKAGVAIACGHLRPHIGDGDFGSGGSWVVKGGSCGGHDRCDGITH